MAAVYHWPHRDIMELPAKGGFYYAQLARQKRYEAMSDAIQTANYSNLEQSGQRAVSSEIEVVMKGPLRPVEWKSTLSKRVREGIEQTRREVAETVRRIKAAKVPFTGKVANAANPMEQDISERFENVNAKDGGE